MFSSNLLISVGAAAAGSGVNKSVTDPLTGFSTLQQVFGFIINLFIGVGWSLVFIYLVLGFIKYITSKGEAKETQAAQQWLTYAVIGGVGLLAITLIKTIVINLLGASAPDVGGDIIPL